MQHMQHNTNVNVKHNIKDHIKDNSVLPKHNNNTEDKERHGVGNKERDHVGVGSLMMQEAQSAQVSKENYYKGKRDLLRTRMMEEAQTLLRLYPPMPLKLLGGGGRGGGGGGGADSAEGQVRDTGAWGLTKGCQV
jgi:hypothetical protein